MEDESAGNSPVVLCFRAIDGEMRGDPIQLHHSKRDSAPELQVGASAQGVGPSCVRCRGNYGNLVIPAVRESNQIMRIKVEPLKATIGGFRTKQPKKFLAVDVHAAGRERS